MKAQMLAIDPAAWRPHALHRDEERAWPETNCYVDLWIGLLHALGLEPVAAMAFTAALDWEGDQFTFFKFPLEDLYELWGLDVMELQVWKGLPQAIHTQLARGRSVIVELDAWHLPDTRGVSYHLEHVKTSVAVAEIDLEAKRLGYFHNRVFHAVAGADWDGLFRVGQGDPAVLPPYVEVVKLDQLRRPGEEALRALALGQLRKHLARRPKQSAVRAWGRDFLGRDLAWLREQPLAAFHGYAFATVRQLGANAGCAGAFARWLGGAEEAASKAEQVAEGAKALQFKLARFANTKKAFDPAPAVEALASAWDAALDALAARARG